MSKRIYEGAIREDIAKSSDDSKSLLRDFSNELFQSIGQGLLQHGHVRLHQFGSFKLKWSKERKGKNPRTGEELIIPAQPRIVFSAAKALKEQTQIDATFVTTAKPAEENLPGLEPIAEIPGSEIDMDSRERHEVQVPETAPAKEIIREPYLTKNIKKPIAPEAESRSTYPQSIAAAIVIALLAFYFFQPSDSEIEGQTPVTEQTAEPVSHEQKTLATIEDNVEADEITQTSIQTEIQPDETIVLEPEIMQYANDSDTSSETVVNIAAETTELVTETTSSPVPETSKPFFTEKQHKLVNGDSLWRLSKKNYINPFYWPHIYQANTKSIYNPNKLLIGRNITLPTLYGHPDDLSDEDRRHIAEGYFLVYRYNKKNNRPFPYYALLGVKKFDPSVIEDHIYEIEETDWENLQLASN